MYDQYEVYQTNSTPILWQPLIQLGKRLVLLFGIGLLFVWFVNRVQAPDFFDISILFLTIVVAITFLYQGARSVDGLIARFQISNRKMIFLDIWQHQTILDWIKVDRIEWNEQGLHIISTKQKSFWIAASFPMFAQLTASCLEWAEFYEVPVFVSGNVKWTSQQTIMPDLLAFR